ncbi:AAA family ATPase [Candidatus Woesearchaeota archaeon]|nr:AAA family ATPase [Candidatus Woesearchaeota archaeon]
MLIKSVKMHNIRSYESQQIDFPIGSVLLAGDIGSGKSTILLAIEFAIFGAKKGELPAYTLLRHGKKEGSVELKMLIDGKDVTIKRTLKRSNDDIKQEAGYVITDGLKKDGTSDELRAVVLEMLGYPQGLVRKGKDLIYRYTVYTPQEEMKQILYEGKDTRLDTLRKVFNIDKYKRVRDNSRLVIASLRERKRHLEGFVLDLEYKKRDIEEKKNEILGIGKKIEGILPKIQELKESISEKRKLIEGIENDIRELNLLKRELGITDTNLSRRVEENNRLNEDAKRLESQIESLGRELEGKKLESPGEIEKRTLEKEKEISEAELNYKSTIRKIKELEVKIEACSDTIRKINELDVCPVCEQKVDEQHRHDVDSREEKKRDELISDVRDFREKETKYEKIRLELKKELDILARQQNHLNFLKLKFENLKDKKSEKEEKSALKEKLKKEIGSLNAAKIELNSKIANYSKTEEKYTAVRKELDGLLPQEKFLEGEKREYEAQKSLINRFLLGMEKEFQEKLKAKEALAHISQLANWIDEMFSSLMLTMEKHVMVNIHSQFNELFKSWFDILMGDESISVRVDEEFTPLIEQDGYETYIENLSGGERTSVALAYRLALNKVVNDIVAGIKTKDIIMLDEPTDGFSSEQLDKVRDVLQQLNMKQIILVSHESKIESFVQNVIRVEKNTNVSEVNL